MKRKTPQRTFYKSAALQLRSGIALCKKCNAFYYKKSWHHGKDKLTPKEARDLKIQFTLCPACEMIKNGLYEGEILIENIPTKFFQELENLVRGFGERAYMRDSEHRIISFKKQGAHSAQVTTTENQLAAKLAKKIKDVFNKVEIEIAYSKEPYEVERIKVTFR